MITITEEQLSKLLVGLVHQSNNSNSNILKNPQTPLTPPSAPTSEKNQPADVANEAELDPSEALKLLQGRKLYIFKNFSQIRT